MVGTSGLYRARLQDDFYATLAEVNGVLIHPFSEDAQLSSNNNTVLAYRESVNGHAVVQTLHGILRAGRSSYGVGEVQMPELLPKGQLFIVKMNDSQPDKGRPAFVSQLSPGIPIQIDTTRKPRRGRVRHHVIEISMNEEGTVLFGLPESLAKDAKWITAVNHSPVHDQENPLMLNPMTWSMRPDFMFGVLRQTKSIIRPDPPKPKKEITKALAVKAGLAPKPYKPKRPAREKIQIMVDHSMYLEDNMFPI